MEREHYRRYTTQKPRKTTEWPEPKRDIREVLLRQCVASGVVLSVVLLLCLIQTPFTQKIRQDLKMALTKQTSMEEAKQTAGKAVEKVVDMENSVKTILGSTPEEPETGDEYIPVDNFGADDDSGLDDDLSTEVFNAEGETPAEFRIDEDILESIQNRTDTYGNQ